MSDTDDDHSTDSSRELTNTSPENGVSIEASQHGPVPRRPPTPGVALRGIDTPVPPPEDHAELNDEETASFLSLVIRNRQITAQLMSDFAEFIDNTESFLHEEENGQAITESNDADESEESDDESSLVEMEGDGDPYNHSYLSGPFSSYTPSVLFENDSEVTLPILVLSDVALVPTQLIPLQFFLPNLIAAMKDLLRGSRTFGVIRSHLQVAGTTAEIVSSQLTNSRGIEVLRVKAVGRQCFVMIGREGEDLLTDGLSTVSYSAKVRILSDVPSPAYRNQAFGASAVMTCACARRWQMRIVSGKTAEPSGRCYSCQARRQMFPAHVIDRFDEHYQCARIILQLEKLCRNADDGHYEEHRLTEQEAEQMDAFTRMTAALATQLNIGWPLKSFIARLSFDVARTSGPLLFIYWMLRNVPIGSQSDTWRILHTYEMGVEKLAEMWNLLNADSDVLYCEQCNIEVTSLRHLFSMCRRKIRLGDPFVSECVSDDGDGGALQTGGDRIIRSKLDTTCGSGRRSPDDGDQGLITIPGDISVIFVNSFGSVHETLSFRHAMNFRAEGAATSDFSWYNGYKWTTIMCRRCFAHLGWKFTRAKRYIRQQADFSHGDPDESSKLAHCSEEQQPATGPWEEDLKKPDEFFGLTTAALKRNPSTTRLRPWSTFLYNHEE